MFFFALEASVGIIRTLMIFSSLISEIWGPLMNDTSGWSSSAAAWTPSPLPLEHQGTVRTCKSLLDVQVYAAPLTTGLATGLAWKHLLFSQNLSSFAWWPRQLNHVFCFGFPRHFKVCLCDCIYRNLLPSNLAAVALCSDWTQGSELLLVWIIDRDQSGGMLQYVHASSDCLGQVVRLSSGAEASFWPFSHVSFLTWNM